MDFIKAGERRLRRLELWLAGLVVSWGQVRAECLCSALSCRGFPAGRAKAVVAVVDEGVTERAVRQLVCL